MNDPTKFLLGAAGGAILALLLVGIFRWTTGFGMMDGGMMGAGAMGGGLLGGLFALLVWALLAALLVAVLVYIVTTLRRH